MNDLPPITTHTPNEWFEKLRAEALLLEGAAQAAERDERCGDAADRREAAAGVYDRIQVLGQEIGDDAVVEPAVEAAREQREQAVSLRAQAGPGVDPLDDLAGRIGEVIEESSRRLPRTAFVDLERARIHLVYASERPEEEEHDDAADPVYGGPQP